MIEKFSKLMLNDIRRDVVGAIADLHVHRAELHLSQTDIINLDVAEDVAMQIDKYHNFRLCVILLWKLTHENAFLMEHFQRGGFLYDGGRLTAFLPYLYESVRHLDDLNGIEQKPVRYV